MSISPLPTAPFHPGSGHSRAVGIISSAGGLPALLELLAWLPASFPSPLFITQHLPRNSTSMLPELLKRRCALDVAWATNGEPPRPGTIYAVRPAEALRLEANRMQVTPQDTHWRGWFSAADGLFASLADTYKNGAVGVVLSGMMAVGVNGLNKIRRAGGTVIAQNKATSPCFEMPAAACDLAKAEIRLAPARIAEALCAMAAI